MKIEILKSGDWQDVKNAAMNTIGADSGKYPSSTWKWKILMAEHSPIRLLELTVRITEVPYWIVMHFVRHKVGIEHFVSTQRTDRTGVDRAKMPQDALVDYTFRANAQAMIAISRKRLCGQAAPETRAVWSDVLDAVKAVEPELYAVCVSECLYRGFCPEMRSCGYAARKGAFEVRRIAYQTGVAVR